MYQNNHSLNHPNLLSRNATVWETRKIFEDKDKYVILDTETTGLGEKDVIIQIAVIDLDGNTLIDTFVKPTRRKSIPRDATDIHGIKFKDLREAPHFCRCSS